MCSFWIMNFLSCTFILFIMIMMSLKNLEWHPLYIYIHTAKQKSSLFQKIHFAFNSHRYHQCQLYNNNNEYNLRLDGFSFVHLGFLLFSYIQGKMFMFLNHINGKWVAAAMVFHTTNCRHATTTTKKNIKLIFLICWNENLCNQHHRNQQKLKRNAEEKDKKLWENFVTSKK